MYEPTDIYLFVLVNALENYLEADEEDADQLIEALPKDVVMGLQNRFLRILKGANPGRELELPGSDGGRPPESVRNFCIALDFHILRKRNGEKYAAAIKILQDRWQLGETAIKSAIAEHKSDLELQFIAQLSRNFANFYNLANVAEKFSNLPPLA